MNSGLVLTSKYNFCGNFDHNQIHCTNEISDVCSPLAANLLANKPNLCRVCHLLGVDDDSDKEM